MEKIPVFIFAITLTYFFFKWMDAGLNGHPMYTKKYRDGKFCKACGAPTYVIQITTGYDAETGEPMKKSHRDCPNRKYSAYKVDTHPLSYD